MQPLKISIPGAYWDSHVYSGRLFLFGADGDLCTLDWGRLIRELPVAGRTRLALVCAFLRSDYLYGSEIQELLHDSEIRETILSKFADLEGKDIEISHRQFQKAERGRQDNPCPFPHADAEVYYRNLYVGGPSGVFRATASGRTKHPVSTRPERIWDAPALALSAGWGRLAIAAGEEGLFQTSVPTSRSRWSFEDRIEEPSDERIQQECLDCNWSFHSVFGSSRRGGFLADYERVDVQGRRLPSRHLSQVISAETLFENPGYSWGLQDKLCAFVRGGIQVVRYSPWEAVEHRFESLGIVRTARWKGEVVAASTAPFGVVVCRVKFFL